jgi:hypothetical protein
MLRQATGRRNSPPQSCRSVLRFWILLLSVPSVGVPLVLYLVARMAWSIDDDRHWSSLAGSVHCREHGVAGLVWLT